MMTLSNRPNRLDIARQFLDAGVSIVPMIVKSKSPAIEWTSYQTELPTPADLERWARDGHQFAAVTDGTRVTLANGKQSYLPAHAVV